MDNFIVDDNGHYRIDHISAITKYTTSSGVVLARIHSVGGKVIDSLLAYQDAIEWWTTDEKPQPPVVDEPVEAEKTEHHSV